MTFATQTRKTENQENDNDTKLLTIIERQELQINSSSCTYYLFHRRKTIFTGEKPSLQRTQPKNELTHVIFHILYKYQVI